MGQRKQRTNLSKADTNHLFGEEWLEAVGTGENARHDIPSMVVYRMHTLTNRSIKAFEAHIEKQFEISLAEFRVIMTLGHMVEGASHEIAELTAISTMNISRAVTKLLKRGYIHAHPDSRNKRRKILQLTREGYHLYQMMIKVSDNVASYLFEDASDEEMVAFSKIMTKLINKMEIKDDSGESVFLKETYPNI